MFKRDVWLVVFGACLAIVASFVQGILSDYRTGRADQHLAAINVSREIDDNMKTAQFLIEQLRHEREISAQGRYNVRETPPFRTEACGLADMKSAFAPSGDDLTIAVQTLCNGAIWTNAQLKNLIMFRYSPHAPNFFDGLKQLDGYIIEQIESYVSSANIVKMRILPLVK